MANSICNLVSIEEIDAILLKIEIGGKPQTIVLPKDRDTKRFLEDILLTYIDDNPDTRIETINFDYQEIEDTTKTAKQRIIDTITNLDIEVIEGTQYVCPSCKMDVGKIAMACPYCQADFEELATVDKNIKKLLIARSEPQETVSMRVAA